MSRPEDGRRKTEDGSRLDNAIDHAVREMLDVEPPAGMRQRVIGRIERGGPRNNPVASAFTNSVASAFRRKAWILAPAFAAAALVVLAVLLPWRSGRTTVAPETHVAAIQRLPLPPKPTRAPVVGVQQMPPQRVVAKAGTRPPRAQQPIGAAVVTTDPEFQAGQVEALAGPALMAVEQLAGPPTPSVQTLGVAPIEIRALEVNAITETPRERREE